MEDTTKDPRGGLPSASGIARIALCPGSKQLESGLKELSSEDAQEGSMLHGHMAFPDTDQSELNPEQLEAIEFAEEKTYALASEYGFEGVKPSNEERLWYRDSKLRAVFSGQSDKLFIKDRRAFMPDYKFGRIKVDSAAGNLQMRANAVLLADNYDVDEIIVALIQPRLGYVTSALYTQEDMTKARAEIHRYLTDADAEDAARVPSYDACHYCKAKKLCPEYNSIMGTFIETSPEELDTPLHLALALNRIQLLKPLIKAVEDAAKAALAEGIDVPGWELGKPRANRRISDPELAMQRLLDLENVTPDTVMAAIKLGIGDTEKIVASAQGVKGKALKDAVASLMDGLIDTKESAAPLKQKK